MGVTRNLAAIYRTPLIEVATKVCFTNTSPVGAYRGAGRPEANYFMERLIDTAAREMGIDQRRAAPAQPHPARGDALQDGVGHDLRQRRVHHAARQGAEARRLGRASPRARPRARRAASCAGVGIGDYLEVTAPPMKEMGGIRFEPNGDVTIITGTLDYGQGHWSPFAQVLTEQARHPVPARSS